MTATCYEPLQCSDERRPMLSTVPIIRSGVTWRIADRVSGGQTIELPRLP